MSYPLSKVWLVIFRTSSNEHVLTFNSRYVANDVFLTVVQYIKEVFPDESIISSNIDGEKNDAYYGLLDKLVEVHLVGQHIHTYNINELTKQYKKELEEEKIYAI